MPVHPWSPEISNKGMFKSDTDEFKHGTDANRKLNMIQSEKDCDIHILGQSNSFKDDNAPLVNNALQIGKVDSNMTGNDNLGQSIDFNTRMISPDLPADGKLFDSQLDESPSKQTAAFNNLTESEKKEGAMELQHPEKLAEEIVLEEYNRIRKSCEFWMLWLMLSFNYSMPLFMTVNVKSFGLLYFSDGSLAALS